MVSRGAWSLLQGLQPGRCPPFYMAITTCLSIHEKILIFSCATSVKFNIFSGESVIIPDLGDIDPSATLRDAAFGGSSA
jgi:hypothetical protein